MSQGPAVPVFILRGHTAPVHTLLFFASNSFLASGDSDGWIVIWSLASKRPVGVWKGHAGGVSGIQIWESHKLITHGRDHKLRVWKLSLDDPQSLVNTLPVEGATADQIQPWLLYSMDMSALNFCSFAICDESGLPAVPIPSDKRILIASPNALDNGGVDIFQLPKERRISQIHSDKNGNTGMVMSVALQADATSESTWVICGYEDGQVGIHFHRGAFGSEDTPWKRLRLLRIHTQPVLSLSLATSQEFVITSSADAQIAKLPFNIKNAPSQEDKPKTVNTKHAGQQGTSIRSDSRIFATAGWDSRIRVYSAKTMKELAVLKWHKDGCYSTAFAEISGAEETGATASSKDERTVVTSALGLIKQERTTRAQKTHWLAAGGKDGKISLWDIY